MPACTSRVGTADTTVTPNTSGAFTPASNDLLIVWVFCTASTDDPSTGLTSSIGGFTFSQFAALDVNSGLGTLYGFVADALVSDTSSQTVTYTPTDAGTGTSINVMSVSGMTVAGASAIRQFKTRAANVAGNPAPDVTFDSAAVSGNPLLGAVANATNPAGLTAPTSWSEAVDIGYDNPTCGLETAFRDSGFTGTNIVWGNSATNWGAIIVELNSAVAPTFDSAPTVSSQTSTAYTLGYDADANATNIYVGLYKKDATAPTAAQLKAGTGALATATEATTGSSDSIVITATESPTYPLYDIYAVLEGPGGFSSVTTLADEYLDATSGFQFVVIDVPAGGGEDSILTGSSPAAVDGDIIRCSATTSPGGYALEMDPDGVPSFDPGIDNTRQSFLAHFYDVSVGAYSDASPVTFYVNNGLPVFTGTTDPLLFEKDVAITAIDLDTRWSDQEADALNITYQDTLPTGLSEASDSLTGTPTVYGESTVTERATDITGDYTEQEVTFQIGPRVPDVVGDVGTSAETELEAIASLTVAYGTAVYSSLVAEGSVVSQSPVATTLVAPNAVVTLILSLGEASAGDDSIAAPLKAVYELPSIVGKVQWVDYWPVQVIVPGAGKIGRTDNDGCLGVTVLSDVTGLTAWVDYIPVHEVFTSQAWRYENDGYIPVNTLTP